MTVGALCVLSAAAALVDWSHAPHRPSSSGLGAASSLKITSFAASPSTVLSGDVVYINLTAQGGTPPYSYWYRGLPPNCPSLNNSSLVCYPRDSEHYVLEGTVNDSAGDQANATTNLTVTSGFGPPPQIPSFRAIPSPGAVGKVTYFVVTAVSESATPTALLSYAFIGLPFGCSSFNQTNLTCIPTEPGSYQVWVRVTDGFAQFNQTDVFFNVTGMGSTTSNGPLFSWTTIEYLVVGLVIAGAVVTVYLLYVRQPPKKPPEGLPPKSEFKPFKMD